MTISITKKIYAALCGLLLLVVAGHGATAGEVTPAALQRLAAATVTVLPQVPKAIRNNEEPEGTGFAVGDGTVLVTANHVLGRANAVLLRLGDGSVIDAEITLRDDETDLAVLSVDEPLPALGLGGTGGLGQTVCAYGNAFGLGPSLSCGVISAVDRSGVGFNRIEDFIQTDAAINPGMSGAPLVTPDGEVIGAVSAIFTKGRDGDLGVNFAASAKLLQAVMEDAADGRIDRRRQGLLLRPEPAPGRTGKGGARVMRIEPGSPESSSELAVGDLVVAINGRRVASHADYLASLALATKGALQFAIDRDGSILTIHVNDSTTK